MTHVVGSPVWAARRGGQVVSSFGLFLLFAVAGGVAAGAALGALLPHYGASWAVFAVISALLLARDWLRVPLPLPQVRLQVPEHLKSRHWAGPIVFGLLLGAGIFTYLPSAVVYIYFFALLLLATPASGAVAGAVFGLAYATGVLILGARTRTLPPIGQAASVKQLFASSRQVTLLAAAVLSVLTTLVESPL